MKTLIILLGSILCLTISASAADIWITTNGTANRTASGTANDPYVTPSAADFDYVMNSYIIPPYSKIHLMGGTFRTAQGINLREGWVIEGAGMDQTTVQVDPSFSPPAYRGIQVIGSPCCGVPHTQVKDLTVDCNLQNLASDVYTYAVALSGSDARISRVKAINYGTTHASNECFVLQIGANGDTNHTMSTNMVIEDCIIGNPAAVVHSNGTTAIIIGGSPEAPFNGTLTLGSVGDAEIRGCSVSDIHPGDSQQPTYFRGFVMSDVVGGRIINNTAFDLGSGGCAVASSCGSLIDYSIDHNQFINVSFGIVFAADDICTSSSYIKRDIYIRDNVITLTNGGIGISIGGFGEILTNVTVENNSVQAEGTNVAEGINFYTAHQINVQNNVVAVNNSAAMNYDTNAQFSIDAYNTDQFGNLWQPIVGPLKTHIWTAQMPLQSSAHNGNLTDGTSPNLFYDAVRTTTGSGGGFVYNMAPQGLKITNLVSEVDIEGDTGIPDTTLLVQLVTFTTNLMSKTVVATPVTVHAGQLTSVWLTNSTGWAEDGLPRMVRAGLLDSTGNAPTNNVWLSSWTIQSVE